MSLYNEDMMKWLRAGFLGTGSIMNAHAGALAKVPELQIVALCNHHVEKAQAFNSKLLNGRATCYDDFHKMLEAEKLDVLYVALPPGAHNGQTEAAAARGIHLMLEKPIALTMERAESISNAVKKAGVKCQIGHHMRHTAPVRKLKGMLEDGSAGRPLMMQGRFFVNGLFPKWWRDPNMGGGQLIEQAIHIYDLARHFLGNAQTIAAFVDNLIHQRFEDYQVDDVSAAVIRFKNGAIGSLCAANCADPTSGSITFTVLCQNVMVEFRGPDDATFIHHHGKVGEEIGRGEGSVSREEIKSTTSSYDELTANFIGAIRGGDQLRSSIEDGVESLRLVLSAARSARTDGSAQTLAEAVTV